MKNICLKISKLIIVILFLISCKEDEIDIPTNPLQGKLKSIQIDLEDNQHILDFTFTLHYDNKSGWLHTIRIDSNDYAFIEKIDNNTVNITYNPNLIYPESETFPRYVQRISMLNNYINKIDIYDTLGNFIHKELEIFSNIQGLPDSLVNYNYNADLSDVKFNTITYQDNEMYSFKYSFSFMWFDGLFPSWKNAVQYDTISYSNYLNSNLMPLQLPMVFDMPFQKEYLMPSYILGLNNIFTCRPNKYLISEKRNNISYFYHNTSYQYIYNNNNQITSMKVFESGQQQLQYNFEYYE